MPASRDFTTIDDLEAALARHAYISDCGLATALFLALKLGRPLLLEGVNKTEAATVLTARLNRPLLSNPKCAPFVRGMQAALSFLDELLPVHNLVSLEQLAATLRAV